MFNWGSGLKSLATLTKLVYACCRWFANSSRIPGKSHWVQLLHVQYSLPEKMTKSIFILCFQKGLDHLLNEWMKGCVHVGVCSSMCMSMSEGIKANVVLNVNFCFMLFTLTMWAEVPFGCNLAQECCHHPNLWMPLNILPSPAPTPHSLHHCCPPGPSTC